MQVPLHNPIENDMVPEYVTEADWIPGFWNFLLALDQNDLIAELVQNDLDQEATRTIITFEHDRIVCEGDGNPVDSQGWQRLRKIQGAGDTVPAKRGKIGIKNHGLKTAFTIGDEIRVLSDGHAITQTLYAHGRNSAPYPGASAQPQPDPQAPAKGCRIEIRYRDRDIEPREGEAVVFAAIGEDEVDALFTSACAATPEQFAGIVSPEVAPRYEIVLRHWRLGEARFLFSCTRARKIARNIEIFRRRCSVTGNVRPLPIGLQEQAARRFLPLKGRLKQRAADFFRRANRFFIEVSWPVDGRDKPQTGTGRFRYPIGYPEGSHEARTGHGAFFNAPIVSDTERHGPARNDATNKALREACETLLIDVLARHAVPRWGPDGLNPLVPSPSANIEDEAVRPLLAALARRGAIPTLTWRSAVDIVARRKKRRSGVGARRGSHEPRKYGFVAPVAKWDRSAIHPALSLVCPRFERQLDPRTHHEIVRLLADGHTDGFCEHFITFDEGDALSRATGEGNDYFPACENPAQEYSQPLIARSYLDVIRDALEHDKCDAGTEEALRDALFLPDSRGQPAPFQALHASAPLPSDIPGLQLPPILHEDLASHPLFRRTKWRRPKYTMSKFLESGSLQEADHETRKMFWKWLRRNERRIASRERAKLAHIAIWPDTTGNLCTLADLCDPRSRRVATVLGDSIRRPDEQVRRSTITVIGKKRATSIRRVPTRAEIGTWLEQQMDPFVPDSVADPDTAAALERFETDLTVLLKDSGVARVLRAIDITLPAMTKDGAISPRIELLMPGKNNDRLALPPRFLLKDKSRATSLDKLSPVLSEPTVEMLFSAFEEDGANFPALQARLQSFLALTEPSDAHREQLAGLPIIPVHGKPRAPRDLAFAGPRGDYWGAWKIRIAGTGLSQDDQRRYLSAGVTSAIPNPETSRSFFEWLAKQGVKVLEQHITCALRHILHRNGPESWAENFTDTPFIPAKNSTGLRLVSLQMAHRRPVYLPDARDIAELVVAGDPGVFLVIDRAREVTEPASEPLRRMGVRSLREALGEPEHVEGAGNTEQATDLFLERFTALRSSRLRPTLLKRFDELGVESDLVRRDWHDRLSRIRDIRFADDVQARFRLHRKLYRVAVAAGFDPLSGTFWIRKGQGDALSTFCEAIAAQLVFKPAARPVHLFALERALELEIHDPTFGQPASAPAGLDEKAESEEESSPSDDENESEDTDTGEGIFGHSPFEPDAKRNVPRPAPIPSGPPSATRDRERQRQPRSTEQDSHGESTPELERQHIDALKRDHYASHCQMCLCERPPQELAPAGSYIEWEEVRRRVVEAHHVDPKSGGGARHAGNLILLCKLHHDNYGRRLTRLAVTDALRAETKTAKVIHFRNREDALSDIAGQIIELMIPDTGEIVAVFFTDDHAAYWLSQAPPPSDSFDTE